VESQQEFDLFTGEWAHRVFVKLYVAARTSGLLAAISDRDWKTLCTLATYMDGEGYCYPSQAELAAAMGCSRQMANERVRSLAQFRFQEQPVLLIVKGSRGSGGKWTGNGYRVLSLSSLRIYGDTEAELPETSHNDSDRDRHVGEGRTVSSRLDTVQETMATVSSQTGTVAVDTNKSHSLEQDRDLSNFEGSHDDAEDETVESETGSQSRSDTPPRDGRLMPLGELGQQRTQLGAGRGGAGDHASAGAGLAPEPWTRRGSDDDPDARERLRAFLEDYARKFGDEAPLSSTITRALNIFTAASVHPAQWGDYLYQAHGLTQEHTASIRKLSTTKGDQLRRKNKMPYFLATLEDLVGVRPAPSTASSAPAKEET
jgi:hypothetical protein